MYVEGGTLLQPQHVYAMKLEISLHCLEMYEHLLKFHVRRKYQIIVLVNIKNVKFIIKFLSSRVVYLVHTVKLGYNELGYNEHSVITNKIN
jgi:hypothetical protein